MEPYRAADPGAVLLKSGRPVLVVPSGITELRANSVVIAWKDTREARRAVADALPLLQLAERITIVEVTKENDDEVAHGRIKDVGQYLARHQVSALIKLAAPFGNSVSKELFRIAKEESADLIVAGGYGHSRLGEWVFGGVTWDLFVANEVCCLLSH
jgi:nucleotide-binding universal stress UspA family protein